MPKNNSNQPNPKPMQPPVQTATETVTKNTTAVGIAIIAAGVAGLAAVAGFFWFSFPKSSPRSNQPSTTNRETMPAWLNSEQARGRGLVGAPGKVMEINLTYDRDHDPILTIDSVRQLNGQAPKSAPTDGEYALQVFKANGEIAATHGFGLPNVLVVPPPETETVGASELILPRATMTVTLDWIPDATKISVLDADRELVTDLTLENIQVVNNQPKFNSIRGSDFLSAGKRQSRSWLPKFIDSASAQNSTPTLDLVFIGDNYLTSADLNTFHNDVNRFTSKLLEYHPFKGRASQIVFHYVDNTSDLECANDPVVTRGINCNVSLVTQAVNNAGVSYDKIAVIVHNSNYGGSGGTLAIAYNGSSGPQVFVHEFGHSIGFSHPTAYVKDEYDNYGYNGPILNRPYYNCLAGMPPTADWLGIVGVNDYQTVCAYPNWYASSTPSIMKTLSSNFFNAISQRMININFDHFAQPFPDRTAPTVNMISPAAGATVNQTVTVSGTASDDTGISWFNFWVDGVLLSTDYSAPYSFSWNTATVSNGNHTVQLKAYDAAGNIGQTEIVTVSVNNASDPTAPTVSITSPTAGSTVSGTISVTANAADNTGVAGVQFKVDGANLGAEDTAAPYSISWDTATSGQGTHVLTAVARDSSGNSTVSAPVSVNVVVPLTISGVSSTQTATSATVRWTTNVPSTGTVTLATSQSQTDNNLSTNHSVTFTGLIKATRYNFTISGASPNNGSATATGSFRTKNR